MGCSALHVLALPWDPNIELAVRGGGAAVALAALILIVRGLFYRSLRGASLIIVLIWVAFLPVWFIVLLLSA
ncbi:MAG: hypothetical protein LH471_01035, partial [Salinibacterium sp.]|nr:hypothetical protein [Salinibacterium sp.]